MAHTRRQFLERLGQTAGTTMTYEAMVAMGLLAVPARAAGASPLQGQGAGTGAQVVILGAGLGGMSTAYELMKLGYDVRVLEARPRPGGRCHTIRCDTPMEEKGESGQCGFEEGLYYNPGPMRIPHHHTATLGYCRELGVPVEVFVNDNDAAFLYQSQSRSQSKTGALAGKRLRGREVRADLGGYTAELLAKAAPGIELDTPLTNEDREALIAYLVREGALQESQGSKKYTGSPRRGYATAPGVQPGAPSTPLALDDLLDSGTGLYLQTEYLQQAPMFQVVGGTDRLAAGFAAKLADRIIYNAEVREIRQKDNGVEISYMVNGAAKTMAADYGVSAIPMTILSKLPVVDLAEDLKKEMAAVQYAASGKIGLQFKRRFWEEDDQIFGGISRTDQEITQIVYPSHGYLGKKGVLIGYYQSGARAAEMAARTHAEREQLALAQGKLIHPQYETEFECSFAVSWQNVKYNEGAWAQMTPEVRKTLFPKLLEPDRRMYFAGDHCSSLTAWMCGALESGKFVAAAVHTRAKADSPRKAVA
jgi:monoamine oxidase